MPFTLLSGTFILIFITAVVIEVFRGANRGFLKTLISLATIIVSIIYSILISPSLSWAVSEITFVFIKDQPFYSSVAASLVNVEIVIKSIMAMIISSVLFVLIFFIMRGFFALIMAILSKTVMNPHPDDPEFEDENAPAYKRNSKIWGAVVGGLCGFIITVAIISPVMGTLKVTENLLDTADTVDEKLLESIDIDKEELEKYSKDPIGYVFYQFGGKLIYSASASINLNSENVSLLGETETLEIVTEDLMYILPMLQDPQSVTQERLERTDALCERFKDFTLIDAILCDYISYVAQLWLDGNDIFGIERPVINELIDPAVDEILEICASTDAYTVEDNMTTVIKVYSIILGSGIVDSLGDTDAMIQFLSESDLIKDIKSELSKNPNMSTALDAISSIALRALVNEMQTPLEGTPEYDLLVENIADALNAVNSKGYGTHEEMVDALTDYTQKYTSEYGIILPENITELASDVIISEMSEISSGGNITVEDVMELFEQYMTH